MPNLLLKMSAPKKQFFLNRLASPSNFLPAIRNLSCAALLLFEVVAGSTPASAQNQHPLPAEQGQHLPTAMLSTLSLPDHDRRAGQGNVRPHTDWFRWPV